MTPATASRRVIGTRDTHTQAQAPHPQALPIELIFAILEEAQYDDLVPKYKWIKNYALVCSAWSSYAQQLLYTSVAIHKGADQCKAFINALAAARNRDVEHAMALGASVRMLSMSLDHQDIYADVLDLCPNLRELHLVLYHACFRPEVLKRFAHAPPVRAMRVRTYHYMPLFQLLRAFVHLQFLEVDCSSVRDVTLELPPSPPPAWGLIELRYHSLRRATHIFVNWALSGTARSTIEVLRVTCPSFTVTELTNMGIAANLKSIVLHHLWETDDLSTFKSLRELALLYPCVPTAPSPTFRTLPVGVRHLSIHALGGRDAAQGMMAALSGYQERSGGSLRVLTYHRRSESTADLLFDAEALYTFCLQRGIEFRLMDPPFGYYAGERIPLEPFSSYPQDVPLSSRRKKLTEEALPWRVRREASLARRFVNAAGRALTGSTVPAMALARP
ncbi:hypothetical protein K466DRAFT_546480 [Polyporus arcularius HHB13444]|uniref:F-box domain-containing protein n=1 Tax=Polyporus arcularius HHB13444 TaxID=1314778 RepID=A0A5C3PKT9_9APHY|nr:hypothetical protein K466DRAFT_546480 [Polyporus arcularius HHB13444]